MATPRATLIVISRDSPRDLRLALMALRERVPESVEEVIVVTPTEEGRWMMTEWASHIRDQGRGKPAALSLAMRAANSEIVVLTDGDVRVDRDAVGRLLAAFEDPHVGAATGRPIAIENPQSSNAMFAWWARVLFDQADRMRLGAAAAAEPIECSGYLYAFRKKYAWNLPPEVLVEDAYISGKVLEAGQRIAYVREATVRVRPPMSLRDWWRQKTRALAGSQQIFLRGLPRMRSFGRELREAPSLLLEIRAPAHVYFLAALLVARLGAWIWSGLKVWRRGIRYADYWQPTETTKLGAVQIGDVYYVADAALGWPSDRQARPVVVLESFGDGVVRVVPRVRRRSQRANIYSPSAPPLFTQAGYFLDYAVTMDEIDLGERRGVCPREGYVLWERVS